MLSDRYPALAAKSMTARLTEAVNAPAKKSAPANDLILGIPAIAKTLGIAEMTVRKMIESGDLPTFELGGRHAIRRAMMEAWFRMKEIDALAIAAQRARAK